MSARHLSVLAGLFFCVAPALGAGSSALAASNSTDPMDWIIQHVCADASNKALSVDPYGGCPQGAHERRLALGEDLPYYRHDQPGENGRHPLGFQRHDAYPLIDRNYGGVFSANDFDFDYDAPYGPFHPGDGDGYDVYRVAGGFVTGGGTRDGGGFSSSFFGADCKPFDGWVFFPTTFLKDLSPGAKGQAVVPIHGVYWEQNGEAYPGKCEIGKGFSNTTLTTWSFETDHLFSGYRGSKPKRIDTIVSTHGLPLQPELHKGYGLERFYFTSLYGATRWEGWTPASNPDAKPVNTCGGETQMLYEGQQFILTACRDWSVVEVNDPPKPAAPWPYPETNVLANWHFTNDTLAPWTFEAESGAKATFALQNSKTAIDLRHSQNHVGVRYLSLDCGSGRAACGASVAQALDREKLPSAKRVDFGVSGAMASEPDGDVEVRLSQTDDQGKELWSRTLTAHFRHAFKDSTPDVSIFHTSSTWLQTVPDFAWEKGATRLSLRLTPKGPGTYDLLDAWVMPR